MAGNFNCHIESEGFLKVTGSHGQCKCGNMLETVQLESFFLCYYRRPL